MMADTKESVRERLEKWRIEKGRPPRPEKPWIPVRKRRETCSSVNSALTLHLEPTKRPFEDVNTTRTPKAQSLKRTRSVTNNLRLNVSNASKRLRTDTFQDFDDKENITKKSILLSVANENLNNGQNNDRSEKMVQPASTISAKRKTFPQIPANSGKKGSLHKSRRERLEEWKKDRELKKIENASKKLITCKLRRMTFGALPYKKSVSSPASYPEAMQEADCVRHRRQTMFINRNRIATNVKQIPEKNPPLKPSKFNGILPGRRCSVALTALGAKTIAAGASKVGRPISQLKGADTESLNPNPRPVSKRTSISAIHRAATNKSKASVLTTSVANNVNRPLKNGLALQSLPRPKALSHSKLTVSTISRPSSIPSNGRAIPEKNSALKTASLTEEHIDGSATGAKTAAADVSKTGLPISQLSNSPIQVSEKKSWNPNFKELSKAQRTSFSAMHRVAASKSKTSIAANSVSNKLNPTLETGLPQEPSALQPLPKSAVVMKPTLSAKRKLPVLTTQISKTAMLNKNCASNKNKRHSFLDQRRPAKNLPSTSTVVAKRLLSLSAQENPKLNLSTASVLKTCSQLTDSRSTRKCHQGILKNNENMKTPLKCRNVAFEIPLSGSSHSSPSLRKRLSSWLVQQNRTPSNYRHLHCFGVQLSELKEGRIKQASNLGGTPSRDISVGSSPEFRSGNALLAGRTPLAAVQHENALPLKMCKSHDETDLVKSVAETEPEELKHFQNILEDIDMLLNNSYSPKEASKWLDAIYEYAQIVRKLSIYWVCRARVSQLSGNVLQAVDLVEMGILLNAQPPDVLPSLKLSLLELRTAPFDEFTPKKKEVDVPNTFASTVIRYCVKDQTPVYQKLCEAGMVQSAPVTVTPVRRSSRLSNSTVVDQHLATPLSNKFSTRCVASLDDIPENIRSRLILIPNRSLKMLMESPPEFDMQSHF